MSAHSLDNPVDHLDTSGNFLVCISKDKAMQVFLCVLGKLIWASLAFLDTTLSPDADLGPAFPFHLLQTISAGTDEKPEEIYFRKLLDGNVNFFGGALGTLLLMILDRRAEIGVILHSTVDEADTLVFQFFTIADLARVSAATMSVVGRRGRGGSDDVGISI